MACAYNTLFYAPGTSDYAGPWHASSRIAAGNVGTAVQPSFVGRRKWHWAQADSGRLSVSLSWCVGSWYYGVWLVGQTHDFLCVLIFTIARGDLPCVRIRIQDTYLSTYVLWYLMDEGSKTKARYLPTYCMIWYGTFYIMICCRA